MSQPTMPSKTARFSPAALYRYGRLAVPALCLIAAAYPAAAQQGVDSNATPTVDSRVPGIEITRLTALPKAPPSASTRQDCGPPEVPKSEGGKITDASGWGVTGEARLGAYDVVSFAGKFEAATSGSCEISAGNVALFLGRQLVALIYAPSHSNQSIGGVQSSGNKLRILDGDIIPMPVGDLRLIGNTTIEVDPLPAADPICNGQGTAPNLYGKSIRQARRTLMAQGWRPIKSSSSDPLSKSLHESGIAEAGGCAGTGFAFCGYTYRKGDMELNVTTFGDGDAPTVAHYAAACNRAQWHPSN
jgi:hypothetical protein